MRLEKTRFDAGLILALFSGFLLLFSGGICFAQQSDPLAAQQVQLAQKITDEWDAIWNGCNTMVRRPILTSSDAHKYLECMFGNMPNYIRTWAEANRDALNAGMEVFRVHLKNNTPEGDTSAADRQILDNIGRFAHQRVGAWHQRMADVVVSLGGINYFGESEVQEIVQVIQKSMNRCTGAVRQFVDKMGAETAIPASQLPGICETYLSEVVDSSGQVIDKMQAVMLNAHLRADRQYQRVMETESLDYNQFATDYDKFLNGFFTALEVCARNLWTPKQQ